MAGKWINCTLADACASIDYGLTASAVESDSGPKFLRITDIVSGNIDWETVPHVIADETTIAKYRLHEGDIVLARTGASTGASAYVKNPPHAVFASYLVRLKAKPEFDPRYLAYYLRSDLFWTYLRGVLGDKSAQPNASASTMTKAPLFAPADKEEQEAIARILGTFDDKIEANRRMNETLEAIARALFKSWFVDFDPVRAKAEGREPAGMDAETAALFPDSFEETELGMVPKGWKVGKIRDIAYLEKNSLNPVDFPDEIFDYYSIPAFDEEKTPKVEMGTVIKSNKFILNSGSVLISKLNPRIPRIWIPKVNSLRRSICSTEFIVVLARPPFAREFLYSLFSSQTFFENFSTMVTGTSGSHQRVKPEFLLEMDTIIPDAKIVKIFSKIIWLFAIFYGWLGKSL